MQNNVLAFTDPNVQFFSDSTPQALRTLLLKANDTKDQDIKGQLLSQAVTEFNENMDAHIALYKFYFRTAQWVNAESAAIRALKVAAAIGGFNRNYRKLMPDTANWLAENSPARFYLFTLKALGVIRLRQGKVKAAIWPLAKLQELDPYGEVGGMTFYEIALGILEESNSQ